MADINIYIFKRERNTEQEPSSWLNYFSALWSPFAIIALHPRLEEAFGNIYGAPLFRMGDRKNNI